MPGSFDGLWQDLVDVGRDGTSGGYRRYTGTAAELTCREWFAAAAVDRGLVLETDRNANLWAWHRPDATGGLKNPPCGKPPLIPNGRGEKVGSMERFHYFTASYWLSAVLALTGSTPL